MLLEGRKTHAEFKHTARLDVKPTPAGGLFKVSQSEILGIGTTARPPAKWRTPPSASRDGFACMQEASGIMVRQGLLGGAGGVG